MEDVREASKARKKEISDLTTAVKEFLRADPNLTSTSSLADNGMAIVDAMHSLSKKRAELMSITNSDAITQLSLSLTENVLLKKKECEQYLLQ